MMRGWATVRALGGLFAAATVSACATSDAGPVVGVAESQPNPSLGQEDYSVVEPQEILLRPADRISVTVFREPDFSGSGLQIGRDGSISLPMIGPVEAGGRTVADLTTDIASRLARAGLRNPRVSVNIDEYAQSLVTVDGAVTQPGVYPFQPGARLSTAIALAQGPSRTADTEMVAVFRETSQGLAVARFDYGAINRGTMIDPVLRPDDRIFIGTDGLSVLWRDFLQALPAVGIFANPSNF